MMNVILMSPIWQAEVQGEARAQLVTNGEEAPTGTAALKRSWSCACTPRTI